MSAYTPEQLAAERRMYERSADWELRNTKRALMILPRLNTDVENARLAAINAILRERAKRARVSLKG